MPWGRTRTLYLLGTKLLFCTPCSYTINSVGPIIYNNTIADRLFLVFFIIIWAFDCTHFVQMNPTASQTTSFSKVLLFVTSEEFSTIIYFICKGQMYLCYFVCTSSLFQKHNLTVRCMLVPKIDGWMDGWMQ